MQLFEKYRPKDLDDVVGQDKAVATIRRVIGRKGWDRDAFWIEGDTGTGKTTIAQCIARELGCPPESLGYQEIDGEKCTVDEVRRLADHAIRCRLFEDLWKVVIVNEAHAMTAKAVQAWLTFLEKLPGRWIVVFTTTQESSTLFGDFNQPFMGRVKCIRLTKVGLKEAFAEHLQRIAKAEELDGKPLSLYQRLVHINRGDMRSCFQAIEMGEMKAVRKTTVQKRAEAGLQRANRKRSRQAKKHNK